MVKNLVINTISAGEGIKKREIHNIAAFLIKNLHFNILNVAINFISSEEIIEINVKHLNHHYSTDIITFNYSGENDSLDGEIFICPEVARNNALIFKVSYLEEIFRLVIHGFLHLLGYNDDTKSAKKEMFELQEKMLHNYINNGKKI